MSALIKAVLFDIDGTLLDSVNLHAESWVRTLAHFGIAAEFPEVRNHIGEGADRLLPAFHGAAQGNRAIPISAVQNGFPPKGAAVSKGKGAIRAHQKGWPQGCSCVIMHRRSAEYEKIAAISDIVDCESTSDDARSSKSAPDIFLKAVERVAPITAHECVVIGDTHFDGEAARNTNPHND